jgi:hypothetical protein
MANEIIRNTRPRKQYRCIRSPLATYGVTLFRRKSIYVIYDDEPNKMYYLTVNGSLGKAYNINIIPKPFEKYFCELT